VHLLGLFTENNINISMKHGIILFAHGSRDPLWSKPIEAIAQAVAHHSQGAIVRCAYLELMQPSLDAVIKELRQQDVTSVRITPMFLGVGKHAREDLPELIHTLRLEYPTITLELLPSIGEHPALIHTITQILVSHL
jgi:sirohydrochlorin cobaltochelatase